MADPDAPTTQAIAAFLEVAMQALAEAQDAARDASRDVHAQSIAAVLLQVEDLRLRNEEYDPTREHSAFPRVLRRWGSQPFAIRVGIARDETRAVYRSLESSTLARYRTPYYVVYEPNETGHREPPRPVMLSRLAEVDSYLWDDPEELKSAHLHERA
jgi:hypothetical protein